MLLIIDPGINKENQDYSQTTIGTSNYNVSKTPFYQPQNDITLMDITVLKKGIF